MIQVTVSPRKGLKHGYVIEYKKNAAIEKELKKAKDLTEVRLKNETTKVGYVILKKK